MTSNIQTVRRFPDWLPDGARLYLSHTSQGLSLRALARREGCHASTVLRHVRRFENRRDDPLVDEALSVFGRLGAIGDDVSPDHEDDLPMTAMTRSGDADLTDETTITREARRVLRRLCESEAMLVIAPDMDQAAVMRKADDGGTIRTAVVARAVARAFALKDWIACDRQGGRVAVYRITPAGRAALKRMLHERAPQADGFAEAADPFGDQHRIWDEKTVREPGAPARKMRYNLAESPVAALARRKDRDGTPFLNSAQVAAAERLREDFEVAQTGPRVAQNWERFLTGGDRGGFSGAGSGPAQGPRAARERVDAALNALGPELSDVALRCCCYLEGLEAAERRMGWSARSGKIVLRIALKRLQRHYDETDGGRPPPIG